MRDAARCVFVLLLPERLEVWSFERAAVRR